MQVPILVTLLLAATAGRAAPPGNGHDLTAPQDAAPVAIAADFSTAADYPLSKTKFGGFNSGMVTLASYRRDSALFDEVRLPSLRIDLAWGADWAGWARPPVFGTATDLQYNFEEMDAVAALLTAHGMLPYWSYCYLPDPLQARPGDYRTAPANPAPWGEVLRAAAQHFKARNAVSRVGYHEIYNEPDNRDFFRGNPSDYFALYREGVRGIRAADADAVVGGPALAFTDDWVTPFLDFVEREQLPLDFFSFHFYPTVPYRSQHIAGVIDDMRRQLAKRPRFATTEMHLNEYNSYRIDYPRGGRQDHFPLASALLHDYLFFLSQPDLTHVNWAQFMDTGRGNYSGMISIEGRRKAVFNAAAIYARVPVDRCHLAIQGPPGLEGMASADSHTASLALWNRSAHDQTVSATLDRVPFPRGNLRVYRIDADHASWGDDPLKEQLLPTETRDNISTGDLRWSGPLPNHGVVFLEIHDGTGLSELCPNPVAQVVRVLRYHPNRATRSYADFDRRTWIARLGMASESQAHEQIGVVAEQLPQQLTIRVQTDGPLSQLDANSLLGIRFDFLVGADYAKSILYHGPCKSAPDLFDPRRNAPMPWGTQRPADQVVTVKDFSHFHVSPSSDAPAGWTGRAQITFLMHNTGPGTRAKIRIER